MSAQGRERPQAKRRAGPACGVPRRQTTRRARFGRDQQRETIEKDGAARCLRGSQTCDRSASPGPLAVRAAPVKRFGRNPSERQSIWPFRGAPEWRHTPPPLPPIALAPRARGPTSSAVPPTPRGQSGLAARTALRLETSPAWLSTAVNTFASATCATCEQTQHANRLRLALQAQHVSNPRPPPAGLGTQGAHGEAEPGRGPGCAPVAWRA